MSGAALLAALSASPFLVKSNYAELSALADAPGSFPDTQQILRQAVSMGAQNVILTLGRAGWVACIEGNLLKGVIDANPNGFDIGAGDAMMAGLALGLTREYSWSDTLTFATRVAAASTYCKVSGEIVLDEVYNSPACQIERLQA